MRAGLRRLLAAGAITLLLAPAGWLATAQAKGVQPRVETLDNGLKLIMVERHEQPTVACTLIFDVGSVNDPRGKSGIAHLFEHMLFKGTRIIGTTDYEAERSFIAEQDALRERMIAEMTRMRLMKRRGQIEDVLDPAQWTPEYSAMKMQYDDSVEAQRKFIINNELADLYSSNGGPGVNAGTAEDMTLYLVQIPSNKLELFFWLESDRMSNGIMREFYVERDNVREERRLRTESTPVGKFDEAFEALFWQSHPYGIPVLGWASEVESITRQDVRDFYKVYYAPNNARLVLVGDFDADQAVEMAKRYFGRIPPCEDPPEPVITEEPRPIAERRFYAEAETNPRVRIRFHTVAIGHTDEAALDVLSEILSGKTGRLYKRLVTQEDAAIGVPGGSNTSRKYAGYFELSAVVKEGHTADEVERLILEEIDKLRDGEISERELQKVKNQVLASSVRGLQSNMGLMFQLAIYDTWYKWEHINEAPQRMLSVTPDDVRGVLQKYFDPDTRTVAIYRTKEGGATTEVDAELARLLEPIPTEHHAILKQRTAELAKLTDLQMLRQQAQMMEQMAGSDRVPEEQKPLFEYMHEKVKARIAELESADSIEADTNTDKETE